MSVYLPNSTGGAGWLKNNDNDGLDLYAINKPDEEAYSAGNLTTISSEQWIDSVSCSAEGSYDPFNPYLSRNGHRIRFDISETNLGSLSVKAFSRIQFGGQAHDYIGLYLANHDTSTWTQLDIEESPDEMGSYTLEGTLTSSLSSYVDTSGGHRYVSALLFAPHSWNVQFAALQIYYMGLTVTESTETWGPFPTHFNP